MIKIEHITKFYGKNKIISEIDLELASGKTHVLLGSSGCGKSTLIRIILGLIPADSGKVFLDNKQVLLEKQKEIAQQVGYVMQQGELFPHLSTYDNICLIAKVREWSKERMDQRITELSEMMSFDKKILSRYPQQLSGGQRQRAAIMRALMLDPRYLFLDEPLGALDPIVQASLQKELKILFNSLKKTVLIVTHNIAEAAYFGHTVTLLNDGYIAQHGTMESLFQKPNNNFVQTFIHAQLPLYMGLESMAQTKENS